MRRGSLSLIRPSLFHYATPGRLPAMAATLFDLVEKSVLKPRVAEVFQLDKVAGGHQMLESGKSMGSIVLRVGGGHGVGLPRRAGICADSI